MDLNLGGIVLAGGHSRRMGSSKAMLPFGPETMLSRIVRIVSEAAETVVVVAAKGQELPPLSGSVIVLRDTQPDCGPLEGIATGLRTLTAEGAVFITGCDVPLLRSSVIGHLTRRLDDYDAVVPVVNELPQPLVSVYRPSVLAEVERLLTAGEHRLLGLILKLHVRQIDAEELRTIDPDLESLRNINTPTEYQAALAAAGLPTEDDS